MNPKDNTITFNLIIQAITCFDLEGFAYCSRDGGPAFGGDHGMQVGSS